MINLRQDLIQKVLYGTFQDEFTYQKLKPSNRFINKLFNHYYVVEHTEHFYDSGSHGIEFNNWIEVYSNGVWGMSQKDVDKISREHLKNIKRCGVSYNGRLYIAEKEDSIFIYYDGRDFALVDYLWIFNRKERDR